MVKVNTEKKRGKERPLRLERRIRYHDCSNQGRGCNSVIDSGVWSRARSRGGARSSFEGGIAISTPKHEATLSEEKIEGCKRAVAVVRKTLGGRHGKRKSKQNKPKKEKNIHIYTSCSTDAGITKARYVFPQHLSRITNLGDVYHRYKDVHF